MIVLLIFIVLVGEVYMNIALFRQHMTWLPIWCTRTFDYAGEARIRGWKDLVLRAIDPFHLIKGVLFMFICGIILRCGGVPLVNLWKVYILYYPIGFNLLYHLAFMKPEYRDPENCILRYVFFWMWI